MQVLVMQLALFTQVLHMTDPAAGESPNRTNIDSTAPGAKAKVDVRRFGCNAKIRPEKIDVYKRHHARHWPELTKALVDHYLRNLSAWVRELEPGEHYVFSYFEYSGDDFEGDFQHLADLSVSQKWHTTVDQDCLVRSFVPVYHIAGQ